MKKILTSIIMVFFIFNCTIVSYATEYMGAWATDNVGTWYRYNDGSYPTCSFFIKDGKLYYTNQDGYLTPNTQLFNGYQTDSDGAIVGHNSNNDMYSSIYTPDGWRQDEKGWWYQYADGSYPKNTDLKINEKRYWVGNDGYMLHDCYARDYGYYGSDGAYTGEANKNATISTIQPSTDTSNNSKSADEIVASMEVDKSLRPGIWGKVTESAKSQLKYKNTAIFPEWNDDGISYNRDPKDGTIMIHGWCQAKNGLGNYVELSIIAMASSNGIVTYCHVSN
ncbi:hypothetical protein LXJ15735_28650 [Lacrimispora xylanolytica]